jgi:fatty-acyl-CoA synthase
VEPAGLRPRNDARPERLCDGRRAQSDCTNRTLRARGDQNVERLWHVGNGQIAKAGSCGLPYVAIQTRIVDDDGRDVPRGETGELWLRGPSITKGYWNKPDVTAAAFAGDWFRTGDAAMQDDDGYFYLVDRKKDMYISGGENVYPAEVEAAIAELEEVAESAVIGVADEKWGEVGRAYIIPRPGASIEPDAIIAHCRARLARFKVPVSVIITDDIPRTASGKVQKHLLKDRG